MTYKNTLQYLLTTVSTLAIAVGATNAAAAPAVRVTTAIGPNQISDGEGFVGGAFNTGDSIELGDAGDSISINNAFDVLGIDLNKMNPTGTITASVTGATLGSIGNGNGAETMNLIVNDGVTLTLSGTATVGNTVVADNYFGLGAVTLGNTVEGLANTILNITANGAVTFDNTFNTLRDTTGNWATLNIANADHIFTGEIGTISTLGSINILTANTITFNHYVTATDINLANGSTMQVNTYVIINAPIDGAGDGEGTLSITGTKPTFNGIIGGNNPLLLISVADAFSANFDNDVNAENITLGNGSTMIVGSDSSINAPINGPVGGGGSLEIIGVGVGIAVSPTFTKEIGTDNPLDLISIADGNFATFRANITATKVVMGNNTAMTIGSNTGQITIYAAIDGAFNGADNYVTSLTISGQGVVFFNKIGFNNPLHLITVGDDENASNATFNANVTSNSLLLANDSNMIALGPDAIINTPINGLDDDQGILVIMNNTTFGADIGSIKQLHEIEINDNVTATFDANVTSSNLWLGINSTMIANGPGAIINALINATKADYQGTLNIEENTTFTADIGATRKLLEINVSDNMTATFNANVLSGSLFLGNDSIMVANSKNATIDTLIVGSGPSQGTLHIKANTTFVQNIGVIQGAANSSLSNIIIDDNVRVSCNTIVSRDVTLGNGSVLNINNGSLLLTAIDGPGTLMIQGPGIAPRIGDFTPLNTVTFVGWNGQAWAPNAGVEINADTMDLRHGTVVKLGAILDNTHITEGFTSGDNSSSGFGPLQSYLLFDNAVGDDITISNLGVSTQITGEGTLFATSATPTGTNKVMLEFSANGEFHLAGPGTIDAITNTSGDDDYGIFDAQLAGGQTLSFSQSIGGAGERIENLALTGVDATSVVNFANANIYAQFVSHNALTINATAAGLEIYSDHYNVTNTTYNIGTKTVKVMSGNVTLEENVTIQASFVAGQPALDISAVDVANLNVEDLTNLTFTVTGGGPIPARDTIMIMITPTADGELDIANDIVTLVNSGLWSLSKTNMGQLIFNLTPDVAVIQAAAAQAQAETGATSTDIANAAEVIINQFGGLGLVPTSSISGGVLDRQSLRVYDPQKFTQDLSTSDGSNAFIAAIGPENTQKGFVAYLNEQIILAANTLFIDQLDQAAAYAIVAQESGFMTAIMADAISNNKVSGIGQPLVQDILQVSAINGPNSAKEMSDRITNAASNSANIALESIGARSAFVNLPSSIFHPTPSSINIGSSSELYAEGEGIGAAAGNSPYDRFGIWGSVNGGTARQKELKGNDGFRLTSTAFVVGIDTMANDYTSIGFAAANSINHIKHNNASDGNKTDATSWIGSLYGNHQFQNNWFVRGAALVNNTHISNKERRVITGGYGVAQSKYNLLSYGGEANIGYYYQFKNGIVATPTVGLRILHSNKISYAETGGTNQNNKNIIQKAMNNYSALAGLSLAKTISRHDISFTPEAHANFQYGINAKSPKGSFVSPLTPSQTTSFVGTKPSKLTSIYGLSVTASHDRIECGFNGDITIASKYVGYQGGVKLKVKF